MEYGEKREPGYGSPGSLWSRTVILVSLGVGAELLSDRHSLSGACSQSGASSCPLWCGSPGPAGRSPPGTVLGARAGRGAPEEEGWALRYCGAARGVSWLALGAVLQTRLCPSFSVPVGVLSRV